MITAWAAAVLVARSARADDAQEFELGSSALDAGQYDQAAKRFATMLDPKKDPCSRGPSGNCRLTDPGLVERARVAEAIAIVAVKGPTEEKRAEARREAEPYIRDLLRANPRYQPNPATVPPEVVGMINQIRRQMEQELVQLEFKKQEELRLKRLAEQRAKQADARWIADVVRQAGQERVVVENSRLVALIPFGVGQLQNENPTLGVVFLVSEVALGGASIVLSLVIDELSTSEKNYDPVALQNRIDLLAAFNRIAFGLWAGATVGGIVQAQAGFVPRRVSYVPRAVPPRPKAPVAVSPSLSVLPRGGGLQLVGTF